MAPRIAYYGDDFTGATDTLATATQGGLRTLLFLRAPTAEMLARGGDLDCVGIAGASRSMTPADMENELRPVAEFFAEVGAPVTHYKTCSTFDSAPAIGNIAVALRVLSKKVPGRYIPIVGGQPNIGRYCVFGHLFAAAESGGPLLRIDRHPMARHPVTPMTESDLRLHLERQGLRNVRSVPYPSYELAPDALTHAVEGASAVLFDVSRSADLAVIGCAIWSEAKQRSLVAAGPSGVTQALCAHWHESGEVWPVPAVPPIAAADGPVLVIAGSLSPVTRRQIESATTFTRVHLDAALLTRGDENYLAQRIGQVSELMRSGHSVIAHTSPLGESLCDETLLGIEIAKATGEFMAQLLSVTQPRRIGIAGGDTSSWTLRALDIWGLSFIGHLAPGVALCRAHSDNKTLDGAEIMLKGGQMGPYDLFLRLRGGA
jgi:uncharacterized protein YgbK (DUF1537 family)